MSNKNTMATAMDTMATVTDTMAPATGTMATANQDEAWSVGSNAADVGGVMTFRIFIRYHDNGDEVPILITTDSQVYTDTMERLKNEEYTESWYEYISDLLDSAM